MVGAAGGWREVGVGRLEAFKGKKQDSNKRSKEPEFCQL